MGLSRGVLLLVLATALTTEPRASTDALQRFLAIPDPTPTSVRALRHLQAHNDHFEPDGWMEVWAELDRRGFRYQVVSQGGSDYIRSHVLVAALKQESELWRPGTDRAGITPANYVFEDRGLDGDGLVSLSVKPRRRDIFFVDGSIFLNPADGDLVRLQGRLTKSPSFWIRHLDIVLWFRRVAGFRLPVAVESSANVLVFGRSTFRMSYEYESIDGIRVGDPQPQRRAAEMR